MHPPKVVLSMCEGWCYLMMHHILAAMDPAKSLVVFRDRVSRSGLAIEKLTPAEALAQVMSFYREVRADKCMLDSEGDMLLFQWGMHDDEEGETFQLELTRQFIQPGDEDEDGMSQLWVILHYDATDQLRDLGNGEHWCESPKEASAFEEFVLASESYRAVVELTPSSVEVDWALI
jgi:hypothetical protein